MKQLSIFLGFLLLLLSACQGTPTPTTPGPTHPADLPDATPVPAEATETPMIPIENPLVGVTWHWQAFEDTAGLYSYRVPDPTNYTLTLQTDGIAAIQAGCNRAGGEYEISQGSLQFATLETTLVECGPDSFSEEFLSHFEFIATYVLQDDVLYLNLAMDGGNLVFSKLAEPASLLDLDIKQVSVDQTLLPETGDPRWVPPTYYQADNFPGPSGMPVHIEVRFGEDARPQPGGPALFLIPVDAYQQWWANNDDPYVSDQIEAIRTLVNAAEPPEPLEGLPALPVEMTPGVNDTAAHWQSIPAQGSRGPGYRFVGHWTRDDAAVNQDSMQYVYQGFSADGEYLIAFFYPMTAESLPQASAGQMLAGTGEYLIGRRHSTGAFFSDDFSPTLDTLDAFVRSIAFD